MKSLLLVGKGKVKNHSQNSGFELYECKQEKKNTVIGKARLISWHPNLY